VRIAFDELDPRILPNMGIKVSFLETPAAAPPGADGADAATADARPVVRVPATAAVRDGEGTYVWRVREDRAERVAVRAGRERDGQLELLSGILAGDIIIARPVEGLTPGAPVAPVGK
jgi:hypothetical protein